MEKKKLFALTAVGLAAAIAIPTVAFGLPDGNGVDLISELKHRNPRLRVLLSSGYTDKHHLMDMARQQEISFLPKPYTLPRLFQTVAEVMRDQRSHMLV